MFEDLIESNPLAFAPRMRYDVRKTNLDQDKHRRTSGFRFPYQRSSRSYSFFFLLLAQARAPMGIANVGRRHWRFHVKRMRCKATCSLDLPHLMLRKQRGKSRFRFPCSAFSPLSTFDVAEVDAEKSLEDVGYRHPKGRENACILTVIRI